MTDDHKWLLGVGAAIVGVIITAALWLHGKTRADMNAMETRLNDAITAIGQDIDRRDDRIRNAEVAAAANEALATVAVRIALNPSDQMRLAWTDSPAEDEQAQTD